MRTFKAASAYFLMVFAVGFALGLVRVPFVVPHLGARLAELLELPVMLAASFLLSRFVLRRHGPFSAPRRFAIGVVALALLVAAELAIVLIVPGQSLAQYVAGRDPVSGLAYLLSLVAFAFMPLLADRGQRPNKFIRADAASRRESMQELVPDLVETDMAQNAMDDRNAMSFAELLSWAWRETPPVHTNRTNLVIHIVAVPLFVFGHVLLIAGFFITPWLFVAAAFAVLVSLAAQKWGHSLERNEVQRFTGSRDFLRRLYAEQFCNFWRFVFSGRWYASLRSSRSAA